MKESECFGQTRQLKHPPPLRHGEQRCILVVRASGNHGSGLTLALGDSLFCGSCLFRGVGWRSDKMKSEVKIIVATDRSSVFEAQAKILGRNYQETFKKKKKVFLAPPHHGCLSWGWQWSFHIVWQHSFSAQNSGCWCAARQDGKTPMASFHIEDHVVFATRLAAAQWKTSARNTWTESNHTWR